MHRVQKIINSISKELKIYQFDLKLKSFVLHMDDDIQKHTLVFEDITLIIDSLKKNKVIYTLDKNDFSICVKFEDMKC